MKGRTPINSRYLAHLYKQGQSSLSIAKNLGIAHTTVLWHLKKINFKTRSRREAAKLGVQTGRIKIFRHTIPDSSKNMTKEKSYVIGVLCGDGWVYINKRKRCYQIALSVADKDFAEEFGRCLQTTYKLRPSFKVRAKRKYNWKRMFQIRLCSKAACMDLLNYGSLFRTKTWLIPNAIKIAHLEIKAHFLKGLFDSEANVERREHRINLTSINMIGLKETQMILNQFGIRSKIIVNKLVAGRNRRFNLRIQDRKSVELFYLKIGFVISRKQIALREVVKSYKQYQTPKENVNKLVPDMVKLRREGYSYEHIGRKLNLSIGTVWRNLNNKTMFPRDRNRITP